MSTIALVTWFACAKKRSVRVIALRIKGARAMEAQSATADDARLTFIDIITLYPAPLEAQVAGADE